LYDQFQEYASAQSIKRVGTELSACAIKREDVSMKSVYKIALMGVSLAALFAPIEVYAQTTSAAADDSDAASDEIIVTGTLIRGTTAVGSQTLSVDAAAIAEKGANSTNELLGVIPQIANAFNGRFEGDPRGIQGSGTSITRPNLRNLPSAGSTSGALTLVLADGLRMTPVGVNQAAIDPDLIPAAVLQGIDIVTDGGSSLYGADAVAGVLNFRTLRKFDGLKVDGNYGFGTTLKSYKAWDASITAGHSWTGGNAYVSASHSNRSEVLNGDTDWSNGIVYDAAGVAKTTFTQCNTPQQTVTRWGRFSPSPTGFTSNTGFPGAGPAALGTGCDRVVEDSYSPKLVRTNVFGALSQEFGDNIDLRITGYWAKRDVELSSYARGATSRGSGITTAVQLTTAFPAALAIPRGSFFTVPEGVGFSFGPNASYVNTPQKVGFDTWGVTPELTVKLGSNWQVRSSAHFGRSNNFQAFPGVDTVKTQCYITGCTGIAAGQLDPLNVAAASAAVIADVTNYENAQQTKQQLIVFRSIADGAIFKLPGGDAKLAIGAEYQQNKADSRLATGTVGLVDTLAYKKAKRNAKSAFAELSLPVTSFLNLNGSVRYDDYSDFGSTTNPSLGLELRPSSSIKLFGHWNKSFNAPTAVDNLAIGTGRFACGIYTAGSVNPAQRPTDQSVLSGGTLPLRDTSRQGTCALVLQGSSPGLQPQTAESWAAGFEVKPANGLRIGGEFYSIDVKNALGTLNPSITSTYLTNPNLYTYNINAADYAAVLATLGNGAALATQQASTNIAIVVDTRISNLNAALIKGIDFHAIYDADIGAGHMIMGITGTRQTKALITNGGVLADKLGRDNPQLYASTFLGWNNDSLSAKVTVNYSGRFRDAAINNVGAVEYVDPFIMTNLNLGYSIKDSSGPLNGTSFRVTVDNVFDVAPQTIRRLNTNNPSFNNWTLGRVIKFGLSKKF
jgi:iron complex outermembrane recepter protein